MEIELPIFGKTKLDEKPTFSYIYEVRKRKYNFEGVPIDLDVHFNTVNREQVLEVSSALNDLQKIHATCKKAIQKDFEGGKVVPEYIEEWNEDIFLQMFEEEQFQKFIEKTDKKKSIEKRLLSLIRIVRIGVYTESEDTFITADFAFGYKGGFREDMVVVTLNPNLEVTDICTEG